MNVNFIKLSGVVCMFFLLSCSKQVEKEVSGELKGPFLQKEFIFPVQDEHAHGSTLAELPNGDVLVAWFQGSGERWADDVRVLGARKKKGSNNWSEPFLMADVKEFPDCNPVLFLDGKNRLWLMWITIIANQWETSLIKYLISDDYENTEGAPTWTWQDVLLVKPGGKTERGIQADDPFVASVHEQLDQYTDYVKNLPGSGEYLERWEKHAQHIRDKAEGKDMMRAGRVQALDGSADASEMGYPYFRRMGWQTRNKPYISEEGRMIIPLYSDGFSISLMAITDDWGNNWSFSTPLIGGGNIQPAIARHRDGSLVAYMRDNGFPPKRLHMSRSEDEGKTWSLVQDSELHNSGTSCDIVTLENGNWVLINNDTESGRNRLTLSLSEDDGKTWPWNRSIADDPNNRSHYPAIVVGKNGVLHVSYSYFQEDNRKCIVYAALNEAWIKEGQ
ncbi:MAG: exo-alpha-sialidase [Cyclobacteriaceae bacterium]|nr:exo-alpha-sialidase [Cyclobacteriaceae bacterium]